MINGEWNPNIVGIGGSETLVTKEYDTVVTSPSIAAIEAIASVKGVDSVALSAPDGITLSDHIDTDALNQLFTAGGPNNVSITFLVNEYRVWIDSNEISITNRKNNSTLASDTDR